MAKPTPTLFHLMVSIAILPFNVLITVPVLIFILTKPNQSGFLSNQSAWIIFPIGILALIAGITLMWQTISLFYKKGKGTLAPWNPTQKLVIEGPYRFVRNPMISGVLCVLIAESLLSQTVPVFYWALFFFVLNYTYFIVKEEPDLIKQFGNDYEVYKKNVPRWIPQRSPWTPN